MQEIIQKYSDKYDKIMEMEFPAGFFDVLKNGYTSFEERRDLYNEKKLVLNQIGDLYRRLVEDLNKKSRKLGFKNYAYYSADEDGIPLGLLECVYDDEGKGIITKLRDAINFPKLDDYDYNTYLGATSLEPLLALETKKEIYINEIFSALSVSKDYRSRISLRLNDEPYNMSAYDEVTKDTVIYVSSSYGDLPQKVPLQEAYIISHEIGHCLQYLELLDRGESPESLYRFEREKYAVEKQNEFASKLSIREDTLVHSQQILEYLTGLFEYNVFTGGIESYSEKFAEIYNSFWWHSNQKENPFYVADPILFWMPGISMLYPVVHMLIYNSRERNNY